MRTSVSRTQKPLSNGLKCRGCSKCGPRTQRLSRKRMPEATGAGASAAATVPRGADSRRISHEPPSSRWLSREYRGSRLLGRGTKASIVSLGAAQRPDTHSNTPNLLASPAEAITGRLGLPGSIEYAAEEWPAPLPLSTLSSHRTSSDRGNSRRIAVPSTTGSRHKAWLVSPRTSIYKRNK